ncbi:YCF48-related protein [Algiphilus sp.]|uniref:WD40/YVTN/BNR-like repeat-containing protein n=1 Tax=Algiphilus sp. TaxID=1872431 RepID=UPI0025C2881B|nr:YCF48-related protein [Algiphilus sp.]MCK5771142.1 photosystem I reaction center subunit IX [Algiphilus sp.]
MSGLLLGLTAAVVPTSYAQDGMENASPAEEANAPSGALGEISGDGRVLVEGVRQERFFGMDFLGDKGIVVGSFGQVMVTEDGGDTWVEEKAPTELALLAVALYDGGAIAVGQQGLVLLRDPGGEWEEVSIDTDERLLNVSVNRHGRAIIVGAFGTLLASSDGGRNWNDVAPEWAELAASANVPADATGATAEPSMYDAEVFDDGVILIAGELAYVLRSGDGGNSWEFVNFAETLAEGQEGVSAAAPTINDIQIRADGNGFAVGQSGTVYKTTDSGRSWKKLSTPLAEINLLSVASDGKGAVIAVGMRSAIFSEDDGESWQTLDALDLDINWYSAIQVAPDAREMLAVGHSGRIIALQ